MLTSPYARARQTAEPVVRALRLADKLRETQALEPSSDPEEILEEVRAEKVEAILLVGHEPHLGALLGRLVAGRPGLEIPMRKAAVARLAWSGLGRGDAARAAAVEGPRPARVGPGLTPTAEAPRGGPWAARFRYDPHPFRHRPNVF